MKKRVAILISGRGSNMAALIEAARDPAYPAQIVGVFSNVPDAPGLATAASYGIPTAWRWHKDYPSRIGFELAIGDVLKLWRPDFIALAGFMRMLTPEFARKWQGRMINIHPSLLPAFPGLHTHRRALAAGCKVTGATVHFVVPEVDHGPIVLQSVVPVLAGDDEDTLAARVLATEHAIYPLAVRWFVEGRLRVDGGIVFHTGGASQVLI